MVATEQPCRRDTSTILKEPFQTNQQGGRNRELTEYLSESSFSALSLCGSSLQLTDLGLLVDLTLVSRLGMDTEGTLNRRL